MKEISQVLLFDSDRRLLVYLRDDNPAIPFPNHWDFFGGHLEAGETPEQALLREVKEELGVELSGGNFFGFIIAPEETLIRILNTFIGRRSINPQRSSRLTKDRG
jgi:8-oxo-dGTP pyrophosphatase MutT (NUDIX family)